jgi:hypothetical protein
MARPKKNGGAGADADREAILTIVRRGLASNPDIPTIELQQRAAASVDKNLAKLDARVFNGRYGLALRRAIARPGRRASAASGRAAQQANTGVQAPRGPRGRRGARSGAGASTGGAGDSRSTIRAVLLDLAQTVAGSDTRTLVETVGNIDRYVDRITSAVQS